MLFIHHSEFYFPLSNRIHKIKYCIQDLLFWLDPATPFALPLNGFSFTGAGFMPNSQNAQQSTAADSGAVYSPRLCNEDLAPTRDQNWSWYNIFSFWMSDVHSMGVTLLPRASLRSGWQAGRYCSACWWGSALCSCAPTRSKTEPDGGRALCGDQPSGVWRLRGQYSGGDPRAYRLCVVRHPDRLLPTR